MNPRSRVSPHDLRSSDQTPYVLGVTLGSALAGAIIVLVLVGTVWPLLAVLVLGAVAAVWAAGPSRPRPRPVTGGQATAMRASFRDWNSEAGAGGELGAPAVAPMLGTATPAAKSTFVDRHA